MHKQYCTPAQNDMTCLMSQRSNHYNISSSRSQIHTHSELIYPTAVTICKTITTKTIKQYHFVTILSKNIVILLQFFHKILSTLPRRLRRRLFDLPAVPADAPLVPLYTIELRRLSVIFRSTKMFSPKGKLIDLSELVLGRL
jgi:hypothetical protein